MFNNKNIFIALTYKCNAFCTKCMTRYHVNKDIEMSEEILERTISLLRKNNYSNIISVGTGEPLLYKRLPSFMDKILSLNDDVRLRMLTNGMLLVPERTEIFNERCKWGITMDAFYQDTLLGLQKGVDVEKVKSNIRNFVKNHGASQLYLNFTVSQANVQEILPFCEFAIENNIKEIYLTELKLFSGYEQDLQEYRLIKDDKFFENIEDVKKLLANNGVFTTNINFGLRTPRKECYKVGRVSPIIDVDGTVSFCSGREDVFVGNIMEDDIEKKWSDFSKELQKTNGKWCEKCYDRILENGTYMLPKTIRKDR